MAAHTRAAHTGASPQHPPADPEPCRACAYPRCVRQKGGLQYLLHVVLKACGDTEPGKVNTGAQRWLDIPDSEKTAESNEIFGKGFDWVKKYVIKIPVPLPPELSSLINTAGIEFEEESLHKWNSAWAGIAARFDGPESTTPPAATEA